MFKERMNAVTKVSAIAEPFIVVLPTALEKMGYYVTHCAKEIGWLGTVTKHKNIFIISDVFLFKQEVHSTTCEITPDGLSDFATELLAREDGVGIWNNIKLWGHSHVNMGVSPSGQDNSQMKTFGEHNEWFVRVIANKSGEMEFTLYDFVNNITFENVKWKEHRNTSAELEEAIKNEIAEKVTELKTTIYYSAHGNGIYTGHGAYGYYDDELDISPTKKNVHQLKTTKEEKDEKTKRGTYKIHWSHVTIPNYFNDKELKEISSFTEINDKLGYIYDVIEDYNAIRGGLELEVSFEDAVTIINYAENKYPA